MLELESEVSDLVVVPLALSGQLQIPVLHFPARIIPGSPSYLVLVDDVLVLEITTNLGDLCVTLLVSIDQIDTLSSEERRRVY